MSNRTLLRMSGVALLIGNLVYLSGIVLEVILGGSDGPPPPTVSLLFAIGMILIIVGMPGFYARLAHRTGLLGLIGWVLFVISGLLYMGFAIGGALYIPLVPASILASPEPPMALLLYFLGVTIVTIIGGVLLGIAIARSGIFPSLIGWFLIASVVLTGVAFPLEGMMSTLVVVASDLLFIAALAWSGYVLLGTAETSLQTSLAEGTLPASS